MFPSNISRNHGQRAFTIVELLIVIVVIAILATITIVAFNGVQQRARDQRMVSAASQVYKAISLYFTDNGRILLPVFHVSARATLSMPQAYASPGTQT